MQRWTPDPLSRAFLIFVQTAIYFTLFASVASLFWVVEKAMLVPVLALSLVTGVWASCRVFLEIGEKAVRIGAYNLLMPRVLSLPISTITGVQIVPLGFPFRPPFLEIVQDERKRQLPFGWLSLAGLQHFAVSLETALKKQNG